MQSLVYIFIALAGLGVGAAAYFGLTFTPIEAFCTALTFVAIAVVVLERTLRRRAEARLERAIEDLSRLLSTDAQAGAVLGQRISALTEQNAGPRLDAVEADISVLGTVVRQVAEAMADLEEARKRQARKDASVARATQPAEPVAVNAETSAPTPDTGPVPLPPAGESMALPAEAKAAISPDQLKQALDDRQLVVHAQSIVTLPQRKLYGRDLVPRLARPGGAFVERGDFMPEKGGETLVRRIERLCFDEAVGVARNSRTAERPLLHVRVSRATLVDAPSIDKIVVVLEADKAVARSIVFAVAEAEWGAMPLSEKAALAAFVKRGAGLTLTDTRSLRLDFAELAGEGVRSVRFDAQRFIESPEQFTDFHTSDVTSYAKRFEVDLVAAGIHTEDQILTLLEDGVAFATGPRIGGSAPLRPEVPAGRSPAEKTPDRAEA